MGIDSVIYIRTDGNSKIATGHLVRCLCIAQALEAIGSKVCFLVSDTDSQTLLHDLAASIFQEYTFSFDTRVLKTAVYDSLESELPELESVLASASRKPTILIDSYYVTPIYLNTLRKFAQVAYMDDLRSFNYNVDLVINYDVIPTSKEKEYRQAYTNAGITLLGSEYTPLRRQFQKQKVTLKDSIENILITTGGSDPYYFTEKIINALLSLGLGTNLHVVVGRLFTNSHSLEQLAKENASIHLHYNVSDMAALMKQCDYAISAAGTTLYELCALGIPSISFTMADNQIIMAETFSETGAIPYAGDIRDNGPEITLMKDKKIHPGSSSSVLTCIAEHLSSSIQDSSKRIEQHNRMRSLVDGNGALKIAKALYQL